MEKDLQKASQTPISAMTTHQKLESLRKLLTAMELDGLIIPHGDEYQNEFVPPHNQRLRYLTNFTGSAGVALILKNKAVVMSDGRYTIQLRQEVDSNLYTTEDSTKTSLAAWLKNNTDKTVNVKIGYDPKLHTEMGIRNLQQSLANTNITLHPTESNLVDQIWSNRPTPNFGTIRQFPPEYAGKTAHEKIENIQDLLNQNNIDAVLLALPDSVSWCLNIRARDVDHNPIILSRLLIYKNGKPVLFIDKDRNLNQNEIDSIGDNIIISTHDKFESFINGKIETIWIDPARAPHHLFNTARLYEIEIIENKDPSIDLKAIKNEAEQNAMRNAHKRDAAAFCKFLSWLDQNKTNTALTELSIADKLESFRKESNLYQETSFDTICGWNKNGAIIHYRATERSFSLIPCNQDGVLLLDSGAQYEDGTTDITRTLCFGTPSPIIKRDNTLVLKGMIAIASAKFPFGTTGTQLDTLARKPLWDAGLDYPHGTGHGVGCNLSVHEEATAISPRTNERMYPGMIVSNEPGFYKENEYGIRIENLILCKDTGNHDALGRSILEFETLTLVPLDKNLIDSTLLNEDEKHWIDNYHARIFKEISPLLSNETDIIWLQDACKAL